MGRLTVFWALTLMCLAQCGCGDMYVGKKYKKGPVLCVGHKTAPCFLTNKINYDDLWLGSPNQPLKNIDSLNVFLELKNGDIISPTAVNWEWLEGKKARWVAERQGEQYGPDLLVEYEVAGCGFFIKDKDLIMIRNYPGIVALWNGSKTKRYTLPLSYEGLVALFGEPDELTPFFGK